MPKSLRSSNLEPDPGEHVSVATRPRDDTMALSRPWVDARILAVDDEPANRALLERLLRLGGYADIEIVAHPDEFMAAWVARTPDIGLIDMHLPGFDGAEVIERLDVLHGPHGVPCVVLTADTSQHTLRRALAAGANDYVTKPLDADEVLLRVRNHLRTRQLYRQVEELAAHETSRAVAFEEVLHHIDDGILIVEASSGRVRYANQMMAAAARLPVPQLLDLTLSDLDRIGFDQPLRQWADDVMGGHQRVAIGETVLRRDGRAMPTEVFVQRLHDGVRQLIVIATRDISQRRASEQQMERALEQQQAAVESLRSANAMKKDFVEAVSHELRTPLTVIQGVAELLHARDQQIDPATRQQLLERLVSNSRRLDGLLVDILDVNRLVGGGELLDRELTDVATLITACVDSRGASSHPIQLELEPVDHALDPGTLERIMANLLGNAVRYTPAGTPIVVRLARAPHGIRIEVEDHGSGVPAALREQIFEPFQRGDQRSSHAPGTGVGLTIVRNLCSMHGGDAWVEEGARGGARFCVTLA